MPLDSELLSLYAESGSEEAFAEVVRRHVDLVHSAALRQVNGDRHLAQDVAQAVFTDLARKAGTLCRRQVLTGWLYTSTHFAAANAVRAERRRRTHEQEAHAMHELLRGPDSDFEWEQLRPVLDSVMHQLNACDRDLILMRYFEGRQLAEIGERLGLSEDAARKRVDRSLERLRLLLAKCGITTTATLAASISTNAVQTAPAGLAAMLTSASLAGAATGSGSAVTFLRFMATTKLKATLVSAIVIASVLTPLIVQRQAQAKLREQGESLQRQTDRLAQLHAENQKLSSLLVQARASRPASVEPFREVLRLRGQVGLLNQDLRELAQPKAAAPLSRAQMLASMRQAYSERVSQLKNVVAANSSELIPEFQFLSEDNWLWLAHKRPLDSEFGVRRALSTTRQMAEENFVADLLRPALQKFVEESDGQFPRDVSQLKPYFKSGVDEAVWQRWVVLPKNHLVPSLRAQLDEDWYITQKVPVNAALDQRILCGLKQVHSFADGPPEFWNVVP